MCGLKGNAGKQITIIYEIILVIKNQQNQSQKRKYIILRNYITWMAAGTLKHFSKYGTTTGTVFNINIFPKCGTTTEQHSTS